MAETNFENATLKLLIEDTDGIVTVASLRQTDSSSDGTPYVDVVYNNTEILTFFNAQGPPIDNDWLITIIAPTEVNPPFTEIFIPTSFSIFLDYRSGSYDGGEIGVGLTIGYNGYAAFTTKVNLGLGAGAGESLVFGSFLPNPPRIDGLNDSPDNGLYVENYDLGSTITGGHADNTMTIRVYYQRRSIP